jgi:outer membrane immunogenic protein
LLTVASGGPALAQSWTGPFVGLTAGYGIGHSAQTDSGIPPALPPLGDGNHRVDGALAGATLGFNWQTGPWVFGLEGDYSWAGIGGSSQLCGANTAIPHRCGAGLDALGTLRGRLGYAMGPTGAILPYFTGGLAVGNLQGWDDLTPSEGSRFRAGWTVGAGIEARIAPQWTAKLEYVHVDLGRTILFDIVPVVPETVSFRADIIRVGLNRSLGDPIMAAPGPIYTKARSSILAKAPAIAPAYDWSGFYLGGNIGGIAQTGTGVSNFFQNSTPDFANNFQPLSPSSSAFIGGVHAGFNWQFARSFVAGVEGDWQWMNSHYLFCRQTDIASAACADNGRGFVYGGSDAKSLATIRGRFGITFDRLMVYGTGGVAFAEIHSSLGTNCLVNGCADQGGASAALSTTTTRKTGWVAGGGIEWMLDANWMVRGEYLHADLGNVTDVLTLDPVTGCAAGGPCGATFSRDLRYDIVRVGASYRFGGPVVARY